ncbi:heat shock 70 kDa protein 12A-like [Saccostrea echinata]|uniref:heat shock 70 kDa protein 12A-like n=1 Tax=Saccostrea echinata TaxID=191078 RepID=UPI002A812461|nr:heat shock 70 kDa protein 12A-like [Saccostrea echinata]
MATAKQDDYLLVAAIDFGTTYSGYAFSTRNDFTRDPTKAYLKQWVDPSSTMMYNKTSTCILFTKEKKFSKFGFEAEAKYLDLIIDDEYRDWYFFKRFKMSLYTLKSSDQNLVIEDETGKSMPALTVFSESIKYLKDSLVDECQKRHTSLKLNEIKWIVTVPAIWSDPAKTLMRSAAITVSIDSEMLTIALEPEAAALFVKHLPVEKKIDGKEGESFQTFAPGSKYIVVDAGGGTIDITAHEVLEDGTVKELLKATGGNWGGVAVDESYMKLIKCLIGDEVTKKIEKDPPSIFFEICRDFEIAKRTIKPDSDMKFTARIPSGLAEEYANVNVGKSMKTLKSVQIKSNHVVEVSFTGDKIRLASKNAEEFFADSIYKISEHLSELFKHESGREITTIILVGGYAESPVLINAIKAEFSHMRIIIPQEAAWSVLRGAVIFGHDPRIIKQRRSKFSYGIKV